MFVDTDSCAQRGQRTLKRYRTRAVTMATLSRSVLCVVLTCIALGAIGCGGGTTGTSPSESLRFTGFAERADGTRAAALSMTVASAGDQEVLVASGTDSEGEFSMNLPESESDMIVDVAGVGASSITRSQSGDGAMAAKLAVTAQGELNVQQFYEAQIDQARSRCVESIEGTRVTLEAQQGDTDPCLIVVAVASGQLALSAFEGRVVGSCEDRFGPVSVAQYTAGKGIELDLTQDLIKSCSDLSIEVSSKQAPGLVSVFQVNPASVIF